MLQCYCDCNWETPLTLYYDNSIYYKVMWRKLIKQCLFLCKDTFMHELIKQCLVLCPQACQPVLGCSNEQHADSMASQTAILLAGEGFAMSVRQARNT